MGQIWVKVWVVLCFKIKIEKFSPKKNTRCLVKTIGYSLVLRMSGKIL